MEHCSWRKLLSSALGIVSLAPRERLCHAKLDCSPFSPSHPRASPSFKGRAGVLPWATISHPAMGKLIFMRTSTIRVCRGIWRPQPLFLASLHQSVWVYLLTICWCFDISLLICLLNERLMTHSWSEVISPWAKNWLLLLPWAIPSHFLTEWMLHSRQNKEDSSPICLRFLSPLPGLCS